MGHIDVLNEDILLYVFGMLSLEDVLSCLHVCSMWRHVVKADDRLWDSLIRENLHIDLAEGSRLLTFDDWRGIIRNHGRYPMSLLLRAHRMWNRLRRWSLLHNPALWESLHPGLSDTDLDQIEETVGTTLPLAMRLIYRGHNGQTFPQELMTHHFAPAFFGGYFFNNFLKLRFFLPLRKEGFVIDQNQHFVVEVAEGPGNRVVYDFTSHNLLSCGHLRISVAPPTPPTRANFPAHAQSSPPLPPECNRDVSSKIADGGGGSGGSSGSGSSSGGGGSSS
eukprot:Rmarinus@m.15918